MRRICLLITTVFLFSSCANYKEEQSDSAVSYFEKDQTCFEYADELYARYEQSGGSVESLFYSPKIDSCVYIFVTSAGLNIHSELINVFTNETIIDADGSVSDFKEKVKELGYMPK